jgi:hypothetical protein
MTAPVHVYGGSVLDASDPTTASNPVGIFAASSGGDNLAADPSLVQVDGTALTAPPSIVNGVLTPFGDTVDRDLYVVALYANSDEFGQRLLMLPANQRAVNSTIQSEITALAARVAALGG